MNKYIIIEGPDRVGKDTQQKLIMKNFPFLQFQTLHYSTLPFKSPEFYQQYSSAMYEDMFKMMTSLKGTGVNLILNRSHLGESVYSPLYRNYSGDYVFELEWKYTKELEDNLYLITLIEDPLSLSKRDDGLSFSSSASDIEKEVYLFYKAHDLSTIKNKILINIESKNADEVSQIIKKFIDN
jgi:thymidylate kinase